MYWNNNTLSIHKSLQGCQQQLTLFRLLSSLNKVDLCGLFFLQNIKLGQFVIQSKLDGVGPVDNRPSPYLRPFIKKKNYMWHLTRDTWHVTADMWHMTCDIWHMVGGEYFLKMSAPKLFWLNELMN